MRTFVLDAQNRPVAEPDFNAWFAWRGSLPVELRRSVQEDCTMMISFTGVDPGFRGWSRPGARAETPLFRVNVLGGPFSGHFLAHSTFGQACDHFDHCAEEMRVACDLVLLNAARPWWASPLRGDPDFAAWARDHLRRLPHLFRTAPLIGFECMEDLAIFKLSPWHAA